MGATNEFLTRIPRRVDCKRNWPTELKARIVAETLIKGEAVNAVAKRYDLKASTVSDWHRMARMGKLVLPNLDGMEFVPVRIKEAKPPSAVPTPATSTIPLFLLRFTCRIHTAIFSFMAGVIPPTPLLGRSLLYVQTHCVAWSCASSIVSNMYCPSHSPRTVRF